MMNLNNIELAAAIKRDEFLEQAKQARLAQLAQGNKRRFRLFSWRLPVLNLRPLISQQECEQEQEVARVSG